MIDKVGLLRETKKNNVVSIIMYLGILLAISIIGYINYGVYHTLITVIKSCVSFLASIITLNSYFGKRNNYMSFIGIGFIYANLFNIMHALTINMDLYFFETNTLTIYIEIISFILAIKFINKDNINYKKIYFFYSLVFIVSIFIIYKYVSIIDLSKNSYTLYFPILIISLLLVLYALRILYLNKNLIQNEIFNYTGTAILLMGGYIFLSIVYNFTQYNSLIITIVRHNLLIIYAYYIYKTIVKDRLVQPYYSLIEANNDLNNKSSLLENTNLLLERINNIQNTMKENLIQREGLLTTILNATINAWIVFDNEKEIEDLNENAEKFFGEKDKLKENIKKLFINYEDFDSHMDKVYLNKETIDEEIYCSDGRVFRCIHSPINSNDKSQKCMCIFIDITSEKSIEQEIIDMNNSYESLIKNIHAPVLIRDEEKVLDVNDAFINVFNISMDDLVKVDQSDINPIDDLIYPDDKILYNEIIATNKAATSNSELYNKGIAKYRVYDGYKNVRWIETYTTIYYEKGRKCQIVTYKDVTIFENTQEKLARSEKKYKRLLDNVPEGIYLQDLQTGKFMYMNKKIRDMFSVDESLKEDELGFYGQDHIFVHPKYYETVLERVKKVEKHEIAPFAQIKLLDKNNKVLDVEIASIPFVVKDNTLKLTIIRDLKEIKKAESMKKKLTKRIQYDKMKMEFFANISHELKTPLNLMFSSNQLIEMLYKNKKIKDYNDIIRRHIKLTKQNSYRLLRLVSNIIDVTKMESGFYKVNLENHNLVDVIEDITLSVSTYADNKGIEIIFDTDTEEKIMAVDTNILERVMLNLLSNAIKFTNPGGYIYVNIYDNNETVQIEVKDTGIGIPKDKLDVIFERFGQVDKNIFRNAEGSGIGLSLVKSLVDLLKGNIYVESSLETGTIFKIVLPVDTIKNHNNYELVSNHNLNVERIHVEFSDIYTND